MDKKDHFLTAVLGEDGRKALKKACVRNPELEAAILPRALWGWLASGVRSSYEGPIPGVEGTYISFKKSEENLYSGTVKFTEGPHSFANESLVYVGACMAVALGADGDRISKRLSDSKAEKLAKTIDTLVKAKVLVTELKKKSAGAEAPGPAAKPHEPMGPNGATPADPTQNSKGPVVGLRPKLPRRPTGQVTPQLANDMGGEIGPKVHPAPTAPSGNTTPQGTPANQTAEAPQVTRNKANSPLSTKATAPKSNTPEPKASRIPQVNKAKGPTLDVTKSEAQATCPVCGGKNLSGSRFTGCLCFRALAKSVSVRESITHYKLTFGSDWDKESVATLTETLKGVDRG